MTNFDAWHFYNKDLFSPTHFVSWGWYSVVAAALERRVFFDNEERPLFPCMYTVFVAPAGVGKGLVMDECAKIMKQPRPSQNRARLPTPLSYAMDQRAPETLFNIAADSTTYESLLVETKNATEPFENHKGDLTVQAALYFLLDEYTSIFKLHAEDLITFLLTAWNGKDYVRKTKNKGHDALKNPCFNLLGSTTPPEFAKILRREIIGTGIMGRTMLVYGRENRSRGIRIPAPTDEQRHAQQQCMAWVRELKGVKMCVKYAHETDQVLERWYADEAGVRINHNPKLDEYYVRKLTHLHKLMMALHFSEPGFERPVPPDIALKAIDILAATEKDMHLALTAGGRNELSPIADAIARYISRAPGGVGYVDVCDKFIVDATIEEIDTILQTLAAQQRIYSRAAKYFTPNH